MRKEGITLNLKKCRFGQHRVKFCGEIIGSGFRSPDPEKVAAVKEIAVPETKKSCAEYWDFSHTSENTSHLSQRSQSY